MRGGLDGARGVVGRGVVDDYAFPVDAGGNRERSDTCESLAQGGGAVVGGDRDGECDCQSVNLTLDLSRELSSPHRRADYTLMRSITIEGWRAAFDHRPAEIPRSFLA